MFGRLGPGPDPEPSSPPPTRLAEARWMATKGTAWLVRRSRDLVPALVGLAVREWLGLARVQNRKVRNRKVRDWKVRNWKVRQWKVRQWNIWGRTVPAWSPRT